VAMLAKRADNSDNSPLVAKYIQPWTCRDGRQVILRPIHPEDRLLEKELIEHLSVESSRFRFFDRIREATPEMLNQFCNIDYVHQIAVIAEYESDGEKRNVSVGRLIIEPETESGEFAIVVADDFQNNGLGTKLMNTLIDICRDKGLKNIYGIVLKDNWKMLILAKKLGFTIEASSYQEVRVVREL
jgi:acetyltransferase